VANTATAGRPGAAKCQRPDRSRPAPGPSPGQPRAAYLPRQDRRPYRLVTL